MTRIEKIIEQGNDYLNWYHDNKPPPSRSKSDDIIIRPCTHPGCTTNVVINTGETLCNQHRSPSKRLIIEEPIMIIKEPKNVRVKPEEGPVVTKLPEEIKQVEPVVVKSVEDIKTSEEVQLDGLNARQIIDLVKELTGQEITICIKSKINIIRHAKIHLEMAGYKII